MLCCQFGTPCDVQDDSTRRFHHNTTFVCNIAVGGVCLILILGILAVHAWRVLRVCRQRKDWSVHLQAAPCMPDLDTGLLGIFCLLLCQHAVSCITECTHIHVSSACTQSGAQSGATFSTCQSTIAPVDHARHCWLFARSPCHTTIPVLLW